LSKELAASYGMSYRQLWRKARAGEIPGAVQTAGGAWYVPPGAYVPRERTTITLELEERIRGALRSGAKPATVARRELVALSTVYKIRDRLTAELEKENARLREVIADLTPKQDALKEGPETVAFHLRPEAQLRGVDPKDLRPEALPRLVDTRAWIDTAYNIIYIPMERLKEYEAKWEHHRKAVAQLPPRPG
jgi:hypothetical protein